MIKSKIVYFSPDIKNGFENIDLNFVSFLNKFVKVDYLIDTSKIKNPPKFSKKIRQSLVDINCEEFGNLKDFLKNINRYDTLIISSLYGVNKYLNIANKINLNTILIDKHFNYDFDRDINAGLIIFKNIYAYRRYKLISKNKINYKITGALQSIYFNKEFYLTKKKFLNKYKLKKKNALILLTGIQHQDYWYKKKIQEIIDVIKKNNFDVLLKKHPNEKNKKKLLNKKSFFHKYKILDNENFYSAIKYSSMIIAISTNAYQEVNLNKKPIIFVDKDKFNLPLKLRDKFNIIDEKKNLNKIKWNKYDISKNAKNFYLKNKTGDMKLLTGVERKRLSNFHYLGAEFDFVTFKKNFNKIYLNTQNVILKKYNTKVNFLNKLSGLNLYKKNLNHILDFIKNNKIKKNKIKYKFNFFVLYIFFSLVNFKNCLINFFKFRI